MAATRSRRGQQPAHEGIGSNPRKRAASPEEGSDAPVASPIDDNESPNKKVRHEEPADANLMDVDGSETKAEIPTPVKKGRAAAKKAAPKNSTAKGKGSSDAKTSDVAIPERRSVRTRAPPKDPYVEGLAAAAADVKKANVTKKEPAPKGGRKKKLSPTQLWSPQNVITENSPLVNADLKASSFFLEFD
jgi:hypothetical protein